MFWKKIGPRKYIILISALLALVVLSTNSTLAANLKKSAQKSSFGRLIPKLKKTTKRFKEIVVSRQPKRRPAQKPVIAVSKSTSEMTETAQESQPKNPTATLPSEATRLSVSASGSFSADIPGAGTATFSKGEVVKVAYSNGTYFLVQDNHAAATSEEPIKFTPGAGSILNLPDFTDMNWNQTTNLNAFRGNIEIVFSNKSKTLWAVNELGLEDYQRGIAEASHDSPEEHLKVMAIVSRSYAVHHLANGGRHAGEPFHLKNSRNGNGDDQVYRGYTAETRLPRIAKAAGDTQGTVVTYQDKPVITPYSTRASGQTRTPAEAGWSYEWPWVKSVPDPDTAGMERLGHGVGLSGHGSKKRAERGDSAATILGYYFPGTVLGQVDTSGQTVRVSIYGQSIK